MSRFYYDLALSTSTPQLKALEAFADPERILYGSDFPYAPKLGIYAGLLAYAKYTWSETRCKVTANRLHANACRLLEKHEQEHCILPGGSNQLGTTQYEFGVDENEDVKEALEKLSN